MAKTALWIALSLLGGLVLASGLELALAGTLYRPTFATGWLLFILLAALVLPWWWPPRRPERFARRMHVAIAGAGLVVAVWAVHVDLRFPRGALDLFVFLLFALFLASTWTGFGIGRSAAWSLEDRRVCSWMRAHALLAFAMLGLGLFHGVFLHAHGLLAHLFLDDAR